MTTLAQAHKGKVLKITCHSTGDTVYSCGSDNCAKVWKLCAALKSLEIAYCVQLTCMPMYARLASSLDGIILLVGTVDGKVTLHSPGMLPVLSKNEDHQRHVTQLDFFAPLRLFASAGLDGVIKVWNEYRELVREIHIGQPVNAAIFANSLGDLAVGLADEVSIICAAECTYYDSHFSTINRNDSL